MSAERERTTSRVSSARGRAKPARRKRGGFKKLVERNTKAVERVHRAVAGFPLDVLGKIGRLEKPVARMRKLQDRAIGARYELVRGIEQEVARLVRTPDAAKRRAARARKARSAGSARTARAEKHAQPSSGPDLSEVAARA